MEVQLEDEVIFWERRDMLDIGGIIENIRSGLEA